MKKLVGYFDRFDEWTRGLEPEWFGMIVFVTATLLGMITWLVFCAILIVLLIIGTNGWIFVGIPMFFIYVFWKAIFAQPKE